MDSVRAWAADPANFASAWNPYDSDTYAFPGGFSAMIESDPGGRVLYSPSTSLEANFPGRMRHLDRSVVPVRVTVEWADGRSIQTFSYVGEPELTLDPTARVVVTGPPGPVPPGGTADFSAQLVDGSGTVVTDIIFRWGLVPVTGNGTLLENFFDRTGEQMRLYHEYTLASGVPAVIRGDVDVSAAARYRGRPLFNGTQDAPDFRINLQ